MKFHYFVETNYKYNDPLHYWSKVYRIWMLDMNFHMENSYGYEFSENINIMICFIADQSLKQMDFLKISIQLSASPLI